ncbi:hypothetical protein AB0C52_12915 [Streptomyces sp. NPDC048717]|uniref:hypothetical protein n=1 Tax=Streptomyces sp. NPDC048717 TaxID=3154928 RepID=UPI00343E0CF5
MLSRVAAPVAAAALLALATVNAPYAAAAVPAVKAAPCVRGESEGRGHSAVDDGEIRWTEASRYDGLRTHAITQWGRLKKIRIAPDTATTVNDLEFRDYTDRRSRTAGYFERHGGIAQTDYIYVNRHWLDTVYKDEPRFRRNILVHELGHALGLCHKPDTRNSVMRTAASPRDVPTAVDRANYQKVWGR